MSNKITGFSNSPKTQRDMILHSLRVKRDRAYKFRDEATSAGNEPLAQKWQIAAYAFADSIGLVLEIMA